MNQKLCKQLIRPRDGREHVLDDDSCSLLLDILVNSSANPHVVRPALLMLTEIANTYQPTTGTAVAVAAGEARGAAGEAKSGTAVEAAAEKTAGGAGDGGKDATAVALDPDREPRWATG